MSDNWRQSVTQWIAEAKAGDPSAAEKLWDRYFRQVVQLARKRLGAAPRRIADEEDVALSVFDTLCRGAASGRFGELKDRDDLWRLLLVITRQKAVDRVRRQTRKKRGEGAVRGDSIFARDDGGLDVMVMAEEPTPDLLVELDEELQRLMQSLRDDTLRRICLKRLEGYSNEEIAQDEGISVRSVERKMQLIRNTWSQMAEASLT